jgi:hypothetical protein
LKAQGYRIRTQTIAKEITPKNRLLIGRPAAEPIPPGGSGAPAQTAGVVAVDS